MSVLSCWSSSTSNVVIFSFGTACKSRICTDALEKPHCGIWGVPFMKRTTGDDATAFCNWARPLSERKRVNVEEWNDGVGRDDRRRERRAGRNMTGDFQFLVPLHRKQVSSSELKLRFVPVNFRAIVSPFFPGPPRDQQLVAVIPTFVA